MSDGPYELGMAPPVRRALGERLPPEVAAAAVELVTGPLMDNPRRIGRELSDELAGIYSTRLGKEWRVLYEIDDVAHVVVVVDIRHRSLTYRAR